MKKTFGLISILVLVLVFALAACGEKSSPATSPEGLASPSADPTSETDELSGKTWYGDSGSELILNVDKSFEWYQRPEDHTDNYFSGTYEVLVGEKGVDYMIDNYGDDTRVIKEQINELLKTEKYKDTEFYVLVLDHENWVANRVDKRADIVVSVAPYYGFYIKNQQWFNSVNQLTDNTSNFRLK